MIWEYAVGIVGILLLLFIILGAPRKKCDRVPSMEGIDDPAVAEAFEKMSNFLPFRVLRKSVVKRLRQLQPTGMLVDIGCGSGKLIIEIAQKFSSLNLVGVDISEEMLAMARMNSNATGLGDLIDFKVGSAEHLPFTDDSIDFLISTLSLHHWRSPSDVFGEIYRVLKPGGTFAVFDFRRNARKAFYGLFTFATHVVVPKALKKVHEPLGSILASYAPGEARSFLSNVPFTNVSVEHTLAWMFILGHK